MGLNWNAFQGLSTVTSASKGTNLELRIPLFDLGLQKTSIVNILVQTNDSHGISDIHSKIISTDGSYVNVNDAISALKEEKSGFEDNGHAITIDGYFGDWQKVNKFSDNVNEVPNLNIDIDEYARQIYHNNTYFYVSVEGEILSGIAVPSPESRASSDSSSSESGYDPSRKNVIEPVADVQLPVDTNTDALRFFIDVDNNEETGFRTLGMPIGAEKLIEIEGVYGIITKSVICDYDSEAEGIWKWNNCELISSAASGSEIELVAEVSGNYFVHMTSWDSWKDSTLAEAYMPIIGRDPYTTITIDGTDDFESDEDITADGMEWYMTWDATNLYFASNADMDGGGGGDRNALAVFMDMNPGTDDGETTSHYDIGWNIDSAIKYDYVALVGKINGMSGSDEVGIKSGDCSSGDCSWTDSKDDHGDWDAHVTWGTGITEMQVPRDWDDSGTIDSDEFPTDQSDAACFTFALVNTNNDYVWAAYPTDDSGSGTVTFTECVYWSELNSDIDDVWNEKQIIDEASDIPEFSTLLMPVASVMLIVGWNNFRRKTS